MPFVPPVTTKFFNVNDQLLLFDDTFFGCCVDISCDCDMMVMVMVMVMGFSYRFFKNVIVKSSFLDSVLESIPVHIYSTIPLHLILPSGIYFS